MSKIISLKKAKEKREKPRPFWLYRANAHGKKVKVAITTGKKKTIEFKMPLTWIYHIDCLTCYDQSYTFEKIFNACLKAGLDEVAKKIWLSVDGDHMKVEII